MNFSAVEHTIVAVDYFINRAILALMNRFVVPRSGMSGSNHRPRRIMVVVTFARWRGPVPRRTIDRSIKREPGAPVLRNRLDDVIPATTSPCYKEAAARGCAAASISRNS
jgi:hypothetical protein